jgi:hypothetical protein
MASNWLTANFVEQVQKAHLKGKPVNLHVDALTNTTLAGLIEYGCLKRALPELPDLPPAITESVLGQELKTIVSEIGLRPTGPSVPPSIDHAPREIEFQTVADADELLSEPVQMMAMRITQRMKLTGFSKNTGDEFQGALFEMLANAIEHSRAPVPTVVGYHIRPGIASFVVADVGRGVYESLRENPDHRDTADHCEALRRAVRPGVSRHREARGNGFRPIFKALAENWGVLRFRSRKGCRTLSGLALNADLGTNHYPPELPGFQVAVTCGSAPGNRDFPVI